MQDVEKAKDKGVQIDGGVELVTADVTKGAEYASPASESLCKTLLIHDARQSSCRIVYLRLVPDKLPSLHCSVLSTLFSLQFACSGNGERRCGNQRNRWQWRCQHLPCCR